MKEIKKEKVGQWRKGKTGRRLRRRGKKIKLFISWTFFSGVFYYFKFFFFSLYSLTSSTSSLAFNIKYNKSSFSLINSILPHLIPCPASFFQKTTIFFLKHSTAKYFKRMPFHISRCSCCESISLLSRIFSVLIYFYYNSWFLQHHWPTQTEKSYGAK